MTLAAEQGFPLWLALSTVLRAGRGRHAGAWRGRADTHTPGPGHLAGHGAELTRSYCLALLAEAYWAGGLAEEALSAVERPWR